MFPRLSATVLLVASTWFTSTSSAVGYQLDPGAPATHTQIPVLDATSETDIYVLPAPGKATMVFIYNNSLPEHRWAMNNDWSLKSFLWLAPLEVDFLFIPAPGNAGKAESLAKQWFGRLRDVMLEEQMPESLVQSRLQQLKFATVAADTCWLKDVAAAWTTEGATLQASMMLSEGIRSLTASRLDAWYDWVPKPPVITTPSSTGAQHDSDVQPTAIVFVSDACFALRHRTDIKGRWVLSPQTEQCRYYDMARHVQEAGGLGLIVQADRHADVEVMMPADVDLDITGGKGYAALLQQQQPQTTSFFTHESTSHSSTTTTTSTVSHSRQATTSSQSHVQTHSAQVHAATGVVGSLEWCVSPSARTGRIPSDPCHILTLLDDLDPHGGSAQLTAELHVSPAHLVICKAALMLECAVTSHLKAEVLTTLLATLQSSTASSAAAAQHVRKLLQAAGTEKEHVLQQVVLGARRHLQAQPSVTGPAAGHVMRSGHVDGEEALEGSVAQPASLQDLLDVFSVAKQAMHMLNKASGRSQSTTATAVPQAQRLASASVDGDYNPYIDDTAVYDTYMPLEYAEYQYDSKYEYNPPASDSTTHSLDSDVSSTITQAPDTGAYQDFIESLVSAVKGTLPRTSEVDDYLQTDAPSGTTSQAPVAAASILARLEKAWHDIVSQLLPLEGQEVLKFNSHADPSMRDNIRATLSTLGHSVGQPLTEDDVEEDIIDAEYEEELLAQSLSVDRNPTDVYTQQQQQQQQLTNSDIETRQAYQSGSYNEVVDSRQVMSEDDIEAELIATAPQDLDTAYDILADRAPPGDTDDDAYHGDDVDTVYLDDRIQADADIGSIYHQVDDNHGLFKSAETAATEIADADVNMVVAEDIAASGSGAYDEYDVASDVQAATWRSYHEAVQHDVKARGSDPDLQQETDHHMQQVWDQYHHDVRAEHVKESGPGVCTDPAQQVWQEFHADRDAEFKQQQDLQCYDEGTGGKAERAGGKQAAQQHMQDKGVDMDSDDNDDTKSENGETVAAGEVEEEEDRLRPDMFDDDDVWALAALEDEQQLKEELKAARSTDPDPGDEVEIKIPMTQISYEDGMILREMIGLHGAETDIKQATYTARTATDSTQPMITFHAPQIPAGFVGVDSDGSLVELGFVKVPTLMHMAWQAQYQVYLDRLRDEVSHLQPDTSLTLFHNRVLTEEHGATVFAMIPGAASDQSLFSRALLEMQLSCQGTRDIDCPQWDHVVQLFACCGEQCQDCPITLWLTGSGSSNSSSMTGDMSSGLHQQHSYQTGRGIPQCGFELGRWITPFRRRVGRWITDVTPLLPMLTPGECSFTAQVPPWAPGWAVSINLHLFTQQQPTLPAAPGATLFSTFPTAPSGGGRHVDSSHHVFSTAVGGGADHGKQPTGLVAEPEHDHGNVGGAGHHHILVTGRAGESNGRRLLMRNPQQLPSMRSTEDEEAQHDMLHSMQYRLRGHEELDPSRSAFEPDAKLVPFHTVKLFEGGVFNKSYNDRQPVVITTPRGMARAVITAVISGHGSDDLNCAEFCPASHHFIVNGDEQKVEFSTAGTAWGCTHDVLQGAVPNERGTWFYGRDGWCDGQTVKPWLADVTHVIGPRGTTSMIQYAGLYEGRDPSPAPDAEPGYIMMSSFITFFKYL